MTTDNRTNVQIVADALRSMPEAERDDDRDPAVVVAEYAVAALSAAQGAAPQAEPDPYQIVRVLHEHQRDTSVVSRVKCVCGVTSEDRASHRLHQAELIAHLEAVPVLPSSGVDEDKLAEVIARASVVYSPMLDEEAQNLARAVAEWLRARAAEIREKGEQ